MGKQDYKKKIGQFRWHLQIEAWIRAGITGIAAGCAGMAAVLLFGRLKYQSLLLTEAGITAAGIFLLVTLFCYLLRFRPRKKEVLARIDALGLQERIITMEELKQEKTVLAEKQRQDARKALAELKVGKLRLRLYIKPLLWCLGMAVLTGLLIVLPLPEKKVDAHAEQNAMEMKIVDEMILALEKILDNSEINQDHKSDIQEILDALELSFTPEDSTLTRTAKIATASKRLDLYEAAEQSEVTVLKQQAGKSEAAKEEVKAAEKEQRLLSATMKEMKDTMGTSIDVLNIVEGTFWTPEGPSAGTSYDVEELPFEEEPAEGEEPPEGEEPGEEEEWDGQEPGEGGEPQEDAEGEMDGYGGQLIYDPEQGAVGYGSVYEEYYREILKALTEKEFSEEVRKMIEDYANTLE